MLFDRQLWELFVSYFETPEIAYERISFPPDLLAITAKIMRRALAFPRSGGRKSRKRAPSDENYYAACKPIF
jgi:hypothetical protein